MDELEEDEAGMWNITRSLSPFERRKVAKSLLPKSGQYRMGGERARNPKEGNEDCGGAVDGSCP
jgi:hypothetical protein